MTPLDDADRDIVDEVVDGFAVELPDIDPLALETVSRLIVAGKTFEHSAAAMLKRFGFSYSDFDVLGMLRSCGPPYEMKPAHLLRFTMITSGAMTSCLDRLERAGMVSRRNSENDRRVRFVRLTDKGISIIEQALDERYQAAEKLLAGISRSDMRALNAFLKVMQSTAADKA